MASRFDPALSGGNDFFHHCCDYCGDDREATGFCANCEDYLCADCFRTHLKPRLLRHHVLLDRSQMPCPDCDYCDDNREAVGFCTNCEDYLCADCFRTHLKPRPSRNHVLLDRSQLPCSKERYRRDTRSYTDSQKHDEPELLSVDEAVCTSRPCHSEPPSGNSGRPNTLQEPVEKSPINYCRPFQSPRNVCFTTTTLLTAVLVMLIAVWLSGQYFREIIREPQTDGHSREIIKDPQTDGHARDIIKEPQTDGHSRQSVWKTSAEHVSDVVVLDDDEIGTKYYFISGSVVILGEKLVTVSHWSCKVKLVDLKTNTVIAELTLPENIRDVTQASTTQVAITSLTEQTIYFVNVSDDEFKLDHSVKVNGDCLGIARFRENLLVTYSHPAKVEILTKEGQVILTLVTETQGKQMFTYPRFVAVSPDQPSIYISNLLRHTVTRLSLTGEVLATYQDEDVLSGPAGVAVDTFGSVYVCGCHSDNVVQLAADLTQPRVLLQESDEIARPYSVSYCQATNMLYIGMLNSRVVRSYQLK